MVKSPFLLGLTHVYPCYGQKTPNFCWVCDPTAGLWPQTSPSPYHGAKIRSEWPGWSDRNSTVAMEGAKEHIAWEIAHL